MKTLCTHATLETLLAFDLFFLTRTLDLSFGALLLFPDSPISAAEFSRVDAEAPESLSPIGTGGPSDSLVSARDRTSFRALPRGLAFDLVTADF